MCGVQPSSAVLDEDIRPALYSQFVPSCLWGFLPVGSVLGILGALVFHVIHTDILELKDRGAKTNKRYTQRRPPLGDPQIIPLSLYTSLPSLVFLLVKNNNKQTSAVIVVVGGRNNRVLVMLQKNYLRGIHLNPTGSSASVY